MSTTIKELIGAHPVMPDSFAEWLECEDMPTPTDNPNKKHRKLITQQTERQKAIEQIAIWLIKHHIRETTLCDYQDKKKKLKYDKYQFSQYLKAQSPLPTINNLNTQKGNLGEVIFCEYLKKTTTFENLVYKLRYSTNTGQAMKGDDLLLFNPKKLKEKVILGEAKYRSNPDGTGIEEIISSFNQEDKLPTSISFVAGVLSDLGQKELSKELTDLQVDMSRGNVPILPVGFFMSNQEAYKEVENHDLYGNFSINQKVIDKLNSLHKPFPINLRSLTGLKFKNFTELKEKINKEIEKHDKLNTTTFESLSKIDKNVRGIKETIDKYSKTDEALIDELLQLGFPETIDLNQIIGRKLNNTNLKTIAPNYTIEALDKGYEYIIHHYADKTQNSKLVCITFAIEDPEKFVIDAFEKAYDILINVENLSFDNKKTFGEKIKDIFSIDGITSILTNLISQSK